MIQSANVGIGISGMEGLQAVNASDYAIGQFRFLKRLLLVHGRWNYRRVSKLVVYVFYKNILFFLTQLWFNIYNGYSGASLHDNWTIALYNTIFTGLPIVALAFMDRDVPDYIAEKYPELYFQGQKNRYFNAKIFISWIVNAVFHSTICFFIPYYCLVDSKFIDGQDIDTQTIGIAVYSCVLAVTLFKLAIETASWTIVHCLFYFGFYLSFPAFVFSYGSVYYLIKYPYPVLSETYSITQRWRIFLSPQFYFILMLVAFACCLRDIFWKGFVRMYDRNFLYELQEKRKQIRKEMQFIK
ncbi:predicted protein [Naegleria gruberi]|uniref:Predicted protein n=1 Tax=Naegleria gruberi TaxID=5762 RepID=D2W4U9_NAEGR|nr:uncharacterized protein NAEGRDRAFT_82334 [Naegleria gruberi]EFC35904.1 predicted protein [Naegleria gruberi]|eukprot:XP_002668648.1 predicted protein [Naegleria gruberi strain NEG-M]